MAPVTVALDWTPNTNHAGFYIAKAKGWYADEGLEVTLLSTHHDGYKKTPAQRVADGSATFAVTPNETVISAATNPAAKKLLAVAALQAVNTSAIVTLASSGLDSPAKLDGCVYASYGARYEGRIVQEMIRAAGGSGDYVEETLPVLGIWDTLLKGRAAATWVFMGWEGVEAARKGVALNVFKLKDYAVPYCPSPVLVADATTLDGALATAFLAATARGFAFAAAQPEEAARLFCATATAENPDLPAPLDEAMCVDSVRYLVAEGAFSFPGGWGRMDLAVCQAFITWLHTSGLLTAAVQSRTPDGVATVSLDALRAGQSGALLPPPDAAALFSNAFLPRC